MSETIEHSKDEAPQQPTIFRIIKNKLRDAALGIKSREALDSLAVAIVGYARSQDQSPYEVSATVITEFKKAKQGGQSVGDIINRTRSFLEENAVDARGVRRSSKGNDEKWRRYFRMAKFVEEVPTRYTPDYWLEERPEPEN